MKTFISLICVLTLYVGCSSDDGESQAEAFARNEAEITAYLETNELTATRTNSGLRYITKTEGTGASPTLNSKVKVIYKGYFLDGRTFDQSKPVAEFNAGGLIPGFTEGLLLMKEGGESTFLLPARIGYGANGAGSSIPGNTVILFDVTLIEVL
ncbi:FKBP-type peptidyl-prolyl cis-trans isomerase [Leeuwenhoekiella sp. MAR_2009_132]|uniref:FKBP-type peptidyl-prolyl cis-trans isomerase n=1 Tax=Leeuwenhoekiella sp. MAR_2009_132 TaxID=1392489 RepID=UPI0004903B6C|nr:FKBP-type peptidyl-prolyl cis-trans isomerase [Leeuwenhoekiella sp. MAR_2009_132]